MIRDLVIIKDGVPLLSKNLSKHEKSVFNQENDLVMLSGFFSAINSFGNQFKNLGSISELKLSNSNLKLLFQNDSKIQNMVFLAIYDEESNSVDVKKFLNNVSLGFKKRFGAEQIVKWAGRRDFFESFEEELDNMLEDKAKKDSEDFFLKTDPFVESKQFSEKKRSLYCEYIPRFKSSKEINPEHYLTGESAYNVFRSIDGKKTISQIADHLKMEKERVYSICKNLIKFGFISLS